ncbi:MAG: tetratricopeptide repeat protein [Myxococcaceae bacterium]
MRQVLFRTVGLLKRPWVAVCLLVVAGGGAGLVFAPLFGVPGFELSLALSIGVGLLGGVVGVAAALQERRLLEGKDPRPKGALRSDDAARSVSLAFGAALGALTLALLPPLAAAVVFSLASTRCDPFAAIAFYPVLTLPSAAMAASVGTLCGFASRRPRWAGLSYAVLVLGSLGFTVWPIVYGPQVFAFNHFLGYFPGPLYDEALFVGPSLLWFRAETLLAVGCVLALTAVLLDPKTGQLTRPHVRVGSLAVLGLCGFGVFTLEVRATSLGTRMSEGALTGRLGGIRESEHFVLVHSRGKPREEIDRFVRDLELRYLQLHTFLGGAPSGKIRVYLYRTAGEKLALVGAAHTQFAKPWRLELHVNDAGFPQPVLKHELMHVMAAPFGTGPFKVTARFGVWPVIGIIEGMAVAGDNPVDELTLHEWSAGMRRQKLMPDVRSLLAVRGFYRAPPARAYTAAGSFLRYLGETHGALKLTSLYARGDFQAAYGRSLDELAGEWERFLDELPLDAAGVNQAFARFRQGSLFSRPCAREVATLTAQAAETLPSDPERALSLYQRCAAIQPDEPSFALAQATALTRAGRKGDAADLLKGLAATLKDQPSTQAEVQMALADLAYARGRVDESRAALEAVLAQDPRPSLDRTARVKLAALGPSASGAAVWSYFQPGADDVKLLVIREALAEDPRNALLSYLLGRRLEQGSAPRLALRYLSAALEGELPGSVRKEALRLLVEAQYLAGDCAAVRTTVGQLPSYGAGFKAAADVFTERCDFEERAFNGPLVPEGPFR